VRLGLLTVSMTCDKELTGNYGRRRRVTSDQRQVLYQDSDVVLRVPIIPRAKAVLDKASARPAHPRYIRGMNLRTSMARARGEGFK
jgi:hypothetical protein